MSTVGNSSLVGNFGNCDVCNSNFVATAWFRVFRCACEQECVCIVCKPRDVRCKEVNMRQHITSKAHIKRSANAPNMPPIALDLSACAIPIVVPKVEIVDITIQSSPEPEPSLETSPERIWRLPNGQM